MPHGIRIGIRAHDLGCFPADELASRVAAEGFDCVQLALAKAVKGVYPESGVIDSALAAEIAAAFRTKRVGIEVMGCYINPIHPNPGTLRTLLDWFKEHLRHARAFGCNIVALESGSLNSDYSPHPDNEGEEAFRKLLGSMRELVAEAGRCGVVVGIEAVTGHVISSPERMRRLLDAIPSPHLRVVFDPVNLLCAENHRDQREIMRRAFDWFGDRIAVVHAKDFRVGGGGFGFCPAGSGCLDYDFLFDWLVRHKPGTAILLEEAGPDQIPACLQFIQNLLLPLTP